MKVIVICGPTASGKTALAHCLAQKYDAEIICADSMQVYKQIPIISASPSQQFTSEIPYHLYNFLNIDQEFSVVKYVQLAHQKIQKIIDRSKLPIIVGGTGMYISALIYGYSDIPNIPVILRKKVRDLYNQLGQKSFFELLITKDPICINKIQPNDKQRALRAYEVYQYTGKSIFIMQKQNVISSQFKFKIFFLNPERQFLHFMCNKRLLGIIDQGAIEEIQALLKNYGKLNISSFKAIGIAEIIAYLENQISLQDAIDLIQGKTRQYAKRQITWFKNQIQHKETIYYNDKKGLFDSMNAL